MVTPCAKEEIQIRENSGSKRRFFMAGCFVIDKDT